MRTEQLSSEGLNKFIFSLEYYESTQSYCLFLSDEYEICDCHFKLTFFLFSFSLFFFFFHLSMHSCRCTWISTAELWVCLSQWWLFRTGDFDIALAVCGLYAKLSFNSCLKSCHIFVNVCLFPYCSWKCLKKWALRSIVVAPFTSDFAWKY